MSYDIQGFFDEQQCSGQLLLNGRRQRYVRAQILNPRVMHHRPIGQTSLEIDRARGDATYHQGVEFTPLQI
jgi:hypothetical protein